MSKSIATVKDLQHRQEVPLTTPTDLKPSAVKDIAGAMNAVLADIFALYLKTKNFHWHMSGPHFRDYHLLLDEHADQIFAMTDPIAERIRKIGGLTIRSIGHVARLQRVLDNDAEYVEPEDMLDSIQFIGNTKIRFKGAESELTLQRTLAGSRDGLCIV
jgi:starvation-inducible DNA-binding protein